MSKVVASIEARMGSTRLPGKVLMDVAGAPALTRLVCRLRRAKRIDGIVLATTVNARDDALVEWSSRENVPCFRGSEDDVLARVVGAQRMMGADVVVEVCGDMPLLDPAVIDMGVVAFTEGDCDVVTTTRKRSFPDGVDAQVFRLKDLEEVAETVFDPAVREPRCSASRTWRKWPRPSSIRRCASTCPCISTKRPSATGSVTWRRHRRCCGRTCA
ncbi:MAG: NTP transferase domain-containing protein [Rhodospirillales bacterium]|nr:NTP transferase domain-containing protein [Rhodospirillales bacterium]